MTDKLKVEQKKFNYVPLPATALLYLCKMETRNITVFMNLCKVHTFSPLSEMSYFDVKQND